MHIIKGVAILLLVAFIVIQFFRPERNSNEGDMPNTLAKQLPVHVEVLTILRNACYDCHSNKTLYPWYMNIQPAAWLMSDHIKEGKNELNFDEFGAYSGRRQLSKLKSIAGRVKDGTMPISAYTFMHKEARLSKVEKELIIDWAIQTRDSLEAAK